MCVYAFSRSSHVRLTADRSMQEEPRVRLVTHAILLLAKCRLNQVKLALLLLLLAIVQVKVRSLVPVKCRQVNSRMRSWS